MILIRVEYYPVLLMGAHSLTGPGYPVFVVAWYYYFYCQPHLGGGWPEILVIWTFRVRLVLSSGYVLEIHV